MLRLCPEPRVRDALRAAFTPPQGAPLEASRVGGEMLSIKMSLEGLSWGPPEGRAPRHCWPSAGVNWEGATEGIGILLVSARVPCPILPPPNPSRCHAPGPALPWGADSVLASAQPHRDGSSASPELLMLFARPTNTTRKGFGRARGEQSEAGSSSRVRSPHPTGRGLVSSELLIPVQLPLRGAEGSSVPRRREGAVFGTESPHPVRTLRLRCVSGRMGSWGLVWRSQSPFPAPELPSQELIRASAWIF